MNAKPDLPADQNNEQEHIANCVHGTGKLIEAKPAGQNSAEAGQKLLNPAPAHRLIDAMCHWVLSRM